MGVDRSRSQNFFFDFLAWSRHVDFISWRKNLGFFFGDDGGGDGDDDAIITIIKKKLFDFLA